MYTKINLKLLCIKELHLMHLDYLICTETLIPSLAQAVIFFLEIDTHGLFVTISEVSVIIENCVL